MDKVTSDGLRQLEALEETVRRAARELGSLRVERDNARAEVNRLRTALHERTEALRQLEDERAEVRARVEKLLAQINALSEAQP